MARGLGPAGGPIVNDVPNGWAFSGDSDGEVTSQWWRARGGFEIDLTWKHGGLERTTVRSLLGQRLRLRRGDTLRSFENSRGTTLTLAGDDLRPDPRR
jgi:hypothetical protein